MQGIEDTKLHEQNSKNGFDILYTIISDTESRDNHADKNIDSEEKAWEMVEKMLKDTPSYYSMIYVVYRRDIHGRKSPVMGYKRRSFLL